MCALFPSFPDIGRVIYQDIWTGAFKLIQFCIFKCTQIYMCIYILYISLCIYVFIHTYISNVKTNCNAKMCMWRFILFTIAEGFRLKHFSSSSTNSKWFVSFFPPVPLFHSRGPHLSWTTTSNQCWPRRTRDHIGGIGQKERGTIWRPYWSGARRRNRFYLAWGRVKKLLQKGLCKVNDKLKPYWTHHVFVQQ